MLYPVRDVSLLTPTQATILMSFMLVQSMTILRRIGYETFLIIHIAFAIVVVYALFRYVPSLNRALFTSVAISTKLTNLPNCFKVIPVLMALSGMAICGPWWRSGDLIGLFVWSV